MPGDKSISHRVALLGAIAEGTTEVRGFLEGADCLATLDALASMGVAVERSRDGVLRIHGVGPHGLRAPAAALDLGNSATSMRLLAGLLAGQGIDSVLVGDASLMKRPMERVAAPLRRMGADVRTNDGLPPFLIGNEDGTESGFMIVQYTAAALVNDLASRAHPASVYSIPTSANAEDHVSMGANEGRHVLDMTADLGHVLALELYTAAQALDYRRDMINAARAVARDQVLTLADVELPPGRLSDRLRAEQDERFFGTRETRRPRRTLDPIGA